MTLTLGPTFMIQAHMPYGADMTVHSAGLIPKARAERRARVEINRFIDDYENSR